MTIPIPGDISPEHTARAMNNDLHPEVKAAYAYVDRVLHTADIQAGLSPAWYGWAIREAFLAGCSHAVDLAQPGPVGPTDEALANFSGWFCRNYPGPDTIIHKPEWHAPKVFRAAAYAIARRGTPAIEPVPVSERWPEFSDCNSFEEVWAFNPVLDHWKLTRINRSIHTHWLPYWALPIPTPTP